MTVPMMDPRRILGAGDVVATSFRMLRERPGLLLLLPLLPVAVLAAVIAVVAGVLLAGDFSGFSFGLVIALIAAYVGVLFAIGLAQWKAQAMQTAAVEQLARGQLPTLRSTWQATSGFLVRILGLVLLGIVVAVGLTVLFAVIVIVPLSRGDGTVAVVGVLVDVAVLFFVAVALFYLGVRLTYVVPSAATQKLGTLQILRRSWWLTEGAFWRTLGYALLGALIASLPSYLVQGVQTSIENPFPYARRGTAEIERIIASYGPTAAVFGVLLLITQWISMAYLPVHLAVMYLNEVNRRSLFGGQPGPTEGWTDPAPTAGASPFAPDGSWNGQPAPGPADGQTTPWVDAQQPFQGTAAGQQPFAGPAQHGGEPRHDPGPPAGWAPPTGDVPGGATPPGQQAAVEDPWGRSDFSAPDEPDPGPERRD